MNEITIPEESKERRFGCLQVLSIIFVVILISVAATFFWAKYYLYASKFDPTKLNAQEEQVLSAKLNQLSTGTEKQSNNLEPEAYSEKGASREVVLTEKELNALIAKDARLAERVAIDLSEDLLSLKIIVPVDEEVLLLGGKNLRINCGVNLGYSNNKPVIALQGISLGGIPIPNAWLGDLKYKNLIEEFGEKGNFWDFFSRGIDSINVQPGRLHVKLKE